MGNLIIPVILAIAIFIYSPAPPRPAKEAVDMPVMTEHGMTRYAVNTESQEALKRQRVVAQQYDYSCGSAALTTILNHHLGEPISESQVIEGMLKYGEAEQIIARRGFSLLDMKRYAISLGYEAGGFRGELPDLLALKQPAVISIRYGGFDHFVVYKGEGNGHVVLADPEFGNLTMHVRDFAEIWAPKVLFVVYPRAELPTAGLTLSNEDLRFMDDDRIRQTALQSVPQFSGALANSIERSARIR